MPSVVEFGQRKLVLENFFGMTGPAKLPADIAGRINTACNEVLAMPDIKKRLLDLGITAVPTSSANFASFVKDQVGVLGPAVKSAGVKL